MTKPKRPVQLVTRYKLLQITEENEKVESAINDAAELGWEPLHVQFMMGRVYVILKKEAALD